MGPALHRTLALVAAALLLGLIGCRQRLGSADLLVITVDTARADRFSYAGDSPVSTPNIDALAAESTAFLEAVAPAPLTLVSHASLFTGLQPPAHGVRNNGTYRLPDSATTLAELLRGRGYRTGAFVGAAVLDSKYGLDQGFDHYDDAVYEDRHHPERRGGEVVRAALAWLDGESDRPTFVWVHLFDPHDPYRPPEPERSLYPHAPYDGEIAYVDRLVGELLAGYRQRQRYRRLVVLLTADHGESLGEHGEETHGVFVYDATVRVPLLLRVPGIGAGRRVATQVQLVDLVPTLADLLDLETPAGGRGRSLVPAMRGEVIEPTPAYAESFLPRENFGWSELKGLRADGWKLVVGAQFELYDLRADPQESRDLAAAEPERLDRLRRLLDAELAATGTAAAEGVEMDDQTRRHLEALGYLATVARRSGAEDRESRTVLPDPRQRIHLSRARSRAIELFDRGFHQGAIERLQAILREDPSNLWVRRQLGAMLLATGRLREAGEQASRLVADAPGAAWAWRLYAAVHERTGRTEEAVTALRAVYAADPADAESRARAWELQLAAGDHETVLAESTAALAADPEDGGALAFRSLAHRRGGDPEGLVAELEAASRSAPGAAEILAALGDAHFAAGRHQLALPLHTRAQTLVPDSNRYAVRLARTLAALGQTRGVWQVLRNVHKRQMFEPEVWLLLGEACLAIGDGPCAAAAMRRAASLVEGPLEPWLLRGPRPASAGTGRSENRRAEMLVLAGRMEEALAVWRGQPRDGGSAPLYEELLLLETPRREAALAGARAELARGRPDAARRALEPHYRARPLDLEIALGYAELCSRSGDDETLRDVLTLLAERLAGGEGPPLRSGLTREIRLQATAALSRAGSAGWDRGVFSNAWHAYFLGAQLVPDDPRTHYNLGLAWERLGDFREALRAFDRTLALSPEFPRAREHRLAVAHAVGERQAGAGGG